MSQDAHGKSWGELIPLWVTSQLTEIVAWALRVRRRNVPVGGTVEVK